MQIRAGQQFFSMFKLQALHIGVSVSPPFFAGLFANDLSANALQGKCHMSHCPRDLDSRQLRSETIMVGKRSQHVQTDPCPRQARAGAQAITDETLAARERDKQEFYSTRTYRAAKSCAWLDPCGRELPVGPDPSTPMSQYDWDRQVLHWRTKIVLFLLSQPEDALQHVPRSHNIQPHGRKSTAQFMIPAWMQERFGMQ